VAYGGGFADFSIPGMDVVSLVVPPGSYWINYTATVFNGDNGLQPDSCSLSGGAVYLNYLTGQTGITLAMQDTASFSTTSTISVYCVGFRTELGLTIGPFLEAIRANALTTTLVGGIN
jgi:hypothetical protein